MFFVLEDDDCVHVYDASTDAVRSIEALDAEECIRAAFDEEGRPYRIEWLKPNQYGRSLLGFQSVLNGQYDLVPAGPPEPASFLALLEKHNVSCDEATISSVVSLRDKLRSQHAEP